MGLASPGRVLDLASQCRVLGLVLPCLALDLASTCRVLPCRAVVVLGLGLLCARRFAAALRSGSAPGVAAALRLGLLCARRRAAVLGLALLCARRLAAALRFGLLCARAASLPVCRSAPGLATRSARPRSGSALGVVVSAHTVHRTRAHTAHTLASARGVGASAHEVRRQCAHSTFRPLVAFGGCRVSTHSAPATCTQHIPTHTGTVLVVAHHPQCRKRPLRRCAGGAWPPTATCV